MRAGTPMKSPALSRILAWTAVVAVTLAVLGLYLRPAFMVTLADQLWGCF